MTDIERDALYELDIESCEPLRSGEVLRVGDEPAWTLYEIVASSNGERLEVPLRSFHDLPLGVGAYRLEWYLPRVGTESLTIRPPLKSQTVALDLHKLSGSADLFVGDIVGEAAQRATTN